MDADSDVVMIAGGDGKIASRVRHLLGARTAVALLPGGRRAASPPVLGYRRIRLRRWRPWIRDASASSTSLR